MSDYGRRRDGRDGRGRRDGPPRNHQQQSSQQQTIRERWPDCLAGGYFDAQGNLKPDYVGREHVEPLVKAKCDGRDGLTSHQIRRYFGHCRATETRLKSGMGVTWAGVLPEIKKLDIAAADGRAKQQPKIPALFHDFIKLNVAAIKSERDFLKGFLPHFEALVGFGTAYFKRERN